LFEIGRQVAKWPRYSSCLKIISLNSTLPKLSSEIGHRKHVSKVYQEIALIYG